MIALLLTLALTCRMWPPVYVHPVDSATTDSIYQRWVVPSPLMFGPRWHMTWGELCRREAYRSEHGPLITPAGDVEWSQWAPTPYGWYRVDSHPLFKQRMPDVAFFVCPHPREGLGLMVAVRGDELYLLPRQLVVLLRDCGTSFVPDSLMSWVPTFTLMYTAHRRLGYGTSGFKWRDDTSFARATRVRQGKEPLIPPLRIERAWLEHFGTAAWPYYNLIVEYRTLAERLTLRCKVESWQPGSDSVTCIAPAEMPGTDAMFWERRRLGPRPIVYGVGGLLWVTLELLLCCVVPTLRWLMGRQSRYPAQRRRLILPDRQRQRILPERTGNSRILPGRRRAALWAILDSGFWGN
jgi:hypothetical protein